MKIQEQSVLIQNLLMVMKKNNSVTDMEMCAVSWSFVLHRLVASISRLILIEISICRLLIKKEGSAYVKSQNSELGKVKTVSFMLKSKFSSNKVKTNFV